PWWDLHPWEFPWLGLSEDGFDIHPFEQEWNDVVTPSETFTKASLGYLAAVAHGKADFLLADDVFLHDASNRPGALVLSPGTSTILAAITQQKGVVDALVAAQRPALPSTDLRSYDAADGIMFALHVTPKSVSVELTDVAAALKGVVSTKSLPVR